MNRREAIAALMALPATASLSVGNVGPDDMIVVECDSYVSEAVAARIKDTLAGVWPGRKVVVCDSGTRLKIAKQEQV